MKTDIVIVGSGCAGLYAALNLPRDKKITIITKADLTSNDSYLAQGGICVLKDAGDYESYFEDTMRAGHYENDQNSVKIMIQSSQTIISDLIQYGVDFQRDAKGELTFTKEGAHSHHRILFHEDITGREITSKLLARVKELDNVEIREYCTMVDLICRGNCCYGVIVREKNGLVHEILANYTMLACGGIGGLYRHSTNYRHLTGDAVALALKHGVELKNIDYVQIHPTTLYSEDQEERSFLISESVRGEGAILLNKNGQRFVNELLPRDVVTKAILEQMEKDHMPYVLLSMKPIPKEELLHHFPNIVSYCKEKGYDVCKEPIRVVPAQHYFMGGIKVDYYSKTTMDQLYAIGETACNGVHGKNRLASNSLLESLVFAKRGAKQIGANFHLSKSLPCLSDKIDVSVYQDEKALGEEYRRLIIEAMERSAS